MALVTTAGSETIRSTLMTDVDASTWYNLITGEQHHIYTVLSISIHAFVLQTANNVIYIQLVGYDAKKGESAGSHNLLRHNFSSYETFVWNDKFSFNGFEPTDFPSEPINTVAEHDLIAAQGGAVSQKLQISSQQAGDNFQIICTYIDQNNE